MKKIELTQGQSALVDNEDYKKLNKYNWYAGYYSHVDNYYAMRQIYTNGKQTTVKMHRIIMDAPRNMQVDHINHNTLDNRKRNLRLCTHNQNQQNQTPSKNTLSQYKGVSWAKQRKKWVARIGINKKRLFLGYFKNEEQAAIAYNKAAKELFGEYALLNEVII